MVKDMWGQSSMNSEGGRSMVLKTRWQLFIQVPYHLKRKKRKFVYIGLQVKKSLCVSVACWWPLGCFQSGALVNEVAVNTLSSPTFGQLPCFSVGPQSSGWLFHHQGKKVPSGISSLFKKWSYLTGRCYLHNPDNEHIHHPQVPWCPLSSLFPFFPPFSPPQICFLLL